MVTIATYSIHNCSQGKAGSLQALAEGKNDAANALAVTTIYVLTRIICVMVVSIRQVLIVLRYR